MIPVAVRSDDMRRNNRQKIVSALRRSDALSRTEISKLTGLSAATVSEITSDMIDENIIHQVENDNTSKNKRGRPRVVLKVNPQAGFVGTLHLQFNMISASLIDYAGTTISEHSKTLDTLKASHNTLKSALISCLRTTLKKAHCSTDLLKNIAVGIQGTADREGTSLLWSPITKNSNLHICNWLKETFDVPARVFNDCDLITRALNWRDINHYNNHFAVILLSHGVGMGLFLHGQSMNGAYSSALEFGHTIYTPNGALCRCGSRGCIEAYAGDYAISRRALSKNTFKLQEIQLDGPDISKIINDALAGKENAKTAFEEAGSAIGYGLANLFALVDPLPVAIVGASAHAANIIEPAIRLAIANSMVGQRSKDVTIEWLPEKEPLIHKGCELNALMMLDNNLAFA